MSDQELEARIASIVKQRNTRAKNKIQALAKTISQKEWLDICRALDMTRSQIGAEPMLLAAAVLWVIEKREHGAADWSVILDKSDEEIGAALGYVDEDDVRAELEPRPVRDVPARAGTYADVPDLDPDDSEG